MVVTCYPWCTVDWQAWVYPYPKDFIQSLLFFNIYTIQHWWPPYFSLHFKKWNSTIRSPHFFRIFFHFLHVDAHPIFFHSLFTKRKGLNSLPQSGQHARKQLGCSVKHSSSSISVCSGRAADSRPLPCPPLFTLSPLEISPSYHSLSS